MWQHLASYGSYCRCCRKFQSHLLYLNTFHKVIRLIVAIQETGFCGGCVLEQSPSRPYAPGTSSIYIINKARTHEDFRLATASNDLVMNMPTPSSSTSKLEHELSTATKTDLFGIIPSCGGICYSIVFSWCGALLHFASLLCQGIAQSCCHCSHLYFQPWMVLLVNKPQ